MHLCHTNLPDNKIFYFLIKKTKQLRLMCISFSISIFFFFFLRHAFEQNEPEIISIVNALRFNNCYELLSKLKIALRD